MFRSLLTNEDPCAIAIEHDEQLIDEAGLTFVTRVTIFTTRLLQSMSDCVFVCVPNIYVSSCFEVVGMEAYEFLGGTQASMSPRRTE